MLPSREFADEIQAMADAAGVKHHKFLVEAIKLGVPLAQYKIALDKVRSENPDRQVSKTCQTRQILNIKV